jgi:hypothetical protein
MSDSKGKALIQSAPPFRQADSYAQTTIFSTGSANAGLQMCFHLGAGKGVEINTARRVSEHELGVQAGGIERRLLQQPGLVAARNLAEPGQRRSQI